MAKWDALFSQIEGIAIRGERCPFNEQLPAGGLSALARAGRIRIEVFRHNWRIVTILAGPHAGKHTLRDPRLERGARPYMVIDGTSDPRRSDFPDAQRREPWKPGTPKPTS